MISTPITKALNPAYRKFKPLRKDIENFKKELLSCIEAIALSDEKNESEEHIKEPIKRFFQNTFYQKNLINTKDRIDLAIYLDETAKSDIGVIIEAKRPSNKVEFISETNLNKKALQELLLYYLRERIDHKNNNIKHLVVTNGIEWFFFKADEFYNLFYKNSELIKEYSNFRDGLKDTTKNELFYSEIASKYIEQVKENLSFVRIKLNVEEVQTLSDNKLSNIYKLFSNVHLLGHSFGNDGNKLNDSFYKELLHLIGLEEIKENSKRIIVRKDINNRDYASLLENTIFTLEDKNYLDRIQGISNTDEKAFSVGLELCITWVNRILFLKLLESQLVSYNNSKSYKFLNFKFLNGYDALNDLFFSALAKPINERHAKYKDRFKNIPYLNSSLFEHSPIEEQTFDITALKDEEMQVYSTTILKDANGRRLKGKLNTLEYVFRFLDAYDFTADVNTEINDAHESKTLINASVLGLIFEKINGYKDGSFYTPAYITMFMCKEAIRKAVIDKFNIDYNNTIQTFEDVKDYCAQFFKKDDLLRFNHTINNLKICDPAVGSGHFLVSALNEIIAIKSELNILCNEDGKRIPCEVIIENDELYVAYNEGELFEYQRQDTNSLQIQKTLFNEKQTVIENCLFGVDINPNSVNICRLRLWIELLKNAYYTSEGELQTLPNIDINIKCGNSLVSRFGLKDSLKSVFKNKEIEYSIEDYKIAVNEYKQTNSKSKKREVSDIIKTVKSNFKTNLDSKIKDKVSKASGDYENEKQRLDNLELFGEKTKKTETDNLKKLKLKAEKITKEKDDILNNVIYKDAFEWRFEFPEVLDNEGNYLGFDVIIGNPPYIQLQKMGTSSDVLQQLNYLTFARTGDIYSLFYELGNNILKKKGLLIFITSNKWMRAAYGESLRKYFVDHTNPLILIDFAGVQIFDSATVDTNILMFSKDKNRQQTKACIIKEKVLNNLSLYFEQQLEISSFYSSESWIVLTEIEQRIKSKIESKGTPLKDWDISINYGIKTGFNEAFIINGDKRKELIDLDSKSDEIIRPILRGRDIQKYTYKFADLYLLFIPWHFPLHQNKEIKGSSDLAENEFKKQFPAIYNHLLQFKKQLSNRNRAETGIRYEWYALQRWGSNYFEDFAKPKITYIEIMTDNPSEGYEFPAFSYDTEKCVALNTAYIMTGNEYELKYIMAVLNSTLGKQLVKYYVVQLQQRQYRMLGQYVANFPIPKLDSNEYIFIANLISEILYKKEKGEEFKELETLIKNKVYSIFNLNQEEVDFIETQ